MDCTGEKNEMMCYTIVQPEITILPISEEWLGQHNEDTSPDIG
jgi:hypothetical protein